MSGLPRVFPRGGYTLSTSIRYTFKGHDEWRYNVSYELDEKRCTILYRFNQTQSSREVEYSGWVDTRRPIHFVYMSIHVVLYM